jgi:hypothetical protein
MWFAAWDHYIGGDTEISVFPPCTEDIDIPWGFETIYVKMENWEEIMTELSAVGRVCRGRDCVPVKYYEFWRHESDFREAGSFQGDLREMIAVFARHERVEDILPDLRRENDPDSMFAAALFATTDVAGSGVKGDGNLFAEAIVTEAGLRYAAPSTSKYLKRFASSLGRFLTGLPPEIRQQISGPLWVSPPKFAELERDRLSDVEELKLMILRDWRLIVRLSQ